MTRVLVTGAQGFIGRAVVADWLAAEGDTTVVGLGRSPRDDDRYTHQVTWRGRRLRSPTPPAVSTGLADTRYQYVAQDLGDTPALTRLLAEIKPDVIVHLAGSLRDEPPARLVRNNLGGVVSIIEATVGSGIDAPRIVFGSSGSVYGVVPGRALPLDEGMPCEPIDPYSVTKLAAERMSRLLCATDGIEAMWARIFNPLGAGQDERHLGGWLGQQIAAIAAGLAPPEISVGPLDTTRDFIDIGETAAALRVIATRGAPGATYNVATGRETSGQDVLDATLAVAGLTGRVTIRRRPGRPADMQRHVAAVDRLAELGFECRRPLFETARDVVEHYLGPVDQAAQTPVAGVVGDAMQRIEVRTGDHTYPVEMAVGLLERLPELLRGRFPDARLAVLTDERVAARYGQRLVERCRAAGMTADVVVVPEGEGTKTLATFEWVIEQLHAARFDRRSVLVNLGGGMITDLGGFVASSYLRGVAYVNVPTTLLAQHDSAIGGKVAVDMVWAKNFVGSFHHPHAVYCDPAVLGTLSPRDLRGGLAEAVKVAICGAPGLFEFLDDHADSLVAADPAALRELVWRSIAQKVALLEPDPYEVDLRRALNLGHTFGHSLEVELAFADVTHGEAVAFGLVVAAMIGRSRGLCSAADAARIVDLLDRFGLPPAVERSRLVAAAHRIDDVRLVRAGRLNYVVPTSTDAVAIIPSLPVDEVIAAVDEVAKDPQAGRAVIDG